MTFELDRLVLSLHGVSAEIAQAAVGDLAGELERCLSSASREWLSRDLGVVVIGPVENAAALDPAALRGLIAERVALALGAPSATRDTEEENL